MLPSRQNIRCDVEGAGCPSEIGVGDERRFVGVGERSRVVPEVADAENHATQRLRRGLELGAKDCIVEIENVERVRAGSCAMTSLELVCDGVRLLLVAGEQQQIGSVAGENIGDIAADDRRCAKNRDGLRAHMLIGKVTPLRLPLTANSLMTRGHPYPRLANPHLRPVVARPARTTSGSPWRLPDARK